MRRVGILLVQAVDPVVQRVLARPLPGSDVGAAPPRRLVRFARLPVRRERRHLRRVRRQVRQLSSRARALGGRHRRGADGPTAPGEVQVVNTTLVALFVPFGSAGGNTLDVP